MVHPGACVSFIMDKQNSFQTVKALPRFVFVFFVRRRKASLSLQLAPQPQNWKLRQSPQPKRQRFQLLAKWWQTIQIVLTHFAVHAIVRSAPMMVKKISLNKSLINVISNISNISNKCTFSKGITYSSRCQLSKAMCRTPGK